jgi:hypothetical protein
MTSKKTGTEKLLNALARGEELTSEQIVNRFGLMNPSSTVHRLRVRNDEQINTVYRQYRGRQVTKYSYASE